MGHLYELSQGLGNIMKGKEKYKSHKKGELWVVFWDYMFIVLRSAQQVWSPAQDSHLTFQDLYRRSRWDFSPIEELIATIGY